MTKSSRPAAFKGQHNVAVFLLLLVQFAAIQLPSYAWDGKDKFWEEADVSEVVKAVQQQRTGISTLECEQLIRLNYRHLYFNALDIDRFIAMPKPKRVLERMSEVFQLNAKLDKALEDARRLTEVGSPKPSQLRSAARRIKDCARGLRKVFRNFFKEDNKGSFEVNIDAEGQGQKGFEGYLDACERISALLNKEIERYFLNPSPGVVTLSAYQTCSIPVLSLSLEELSAAIEKSCSE